MPDHARGALWEKARSVLCVRLDALGDVLMSGPAMRALASAPTRRRITLLTSSAGCAAGSLLGCVDDVLWYEAPWVSPGSGAPDGPSHDALVAELRRRDFDAAVIFTVYSQSPLPAALTCCLADIPLRLAHCRENPYGLLTDWVPEPEPEDGVRHEVRRQLDLVGAVGARTEDEHLRLDLPQGARASVGRLLERLGLSAGRRWAVVHPGSRAPSRRYPAEAYAAACRRLVEHHAITPVFTGDEDEAELIDQIRGELTGESHSLAGRLDLGELAALLVAAPVLVAGNSGPIHVAAAVGTPVVDLYALTNPQHGPWGVPSTVLFRDVPCRWCYRSVCPEGHHRCLRGVPPEEVADAAAAFVDQRQRSPGAAGDPLAVWRRAPGRARAAVGRATPSSRRRAARSPDDADERRVAGSAHG